ncbi:hypothetical protein [Jannaschia seohaensis]|uniref:Uncharacterized protein n=1 Tax=Jannaschia seohaensis TaxID=475081 RepID=A0A2Y9ANS0_9RHOB|nr:hypothetical protein [Jannaschia seohaensis]PWJ19358.1 hypothetical protein BCF38_104294 [Jannaschia seohaensis]SSA46020.1 hypothetical protein SAMN05421539_104294 [Jannaschia seohaensis]
MTDVSPIALLSGIIAQGGKVAADSYRDCDGYGPLVTAGLVRREGLVSSVLCEACDIGHEAPVLYESDTYGHVCPEAGFVPMARGDLIAIAPDLEVLATQIAGALGCRERAPRHIGDGIWHVGTVRTEAADVGVYFCARLQTSDDLHLLDAALRDQVRRRFGLVLTAHGTLQMPGMTTAPLDQVIGFDGARGCLVADADPTTLVNAPITRKGGRPNLHGERIRAIIADRTTSSQAEVGNNAEVRAILAEYQQKHPNEPQPSRSTIRRHLSAARGGS